MSCGFPAPIYPAALLSGVQKSLPLADGYQIYINFNYAVASIPSHVIGYNIYFSTNMDDVFIEGPKYFTQELELTISQFNPGQIYWFGVRAMEYDPLLQDFTGFAPSPHAVNAGIYHETALSEDINSSQLDIPLIDVDGFPHRGIVQIGVELVGYSNIDYANNIIYAYSNGRGFYGTSPRSHSAIDGYDGYWFQNPVVRYFPGFEEKNTVVSEAEARIEYPEFPFVASDGYKQTIKNILTTDLDASDASNEGFPAYDYSGYHQTNIIDYFSGHCIGSFVGGEYGCADGYKMRGLNIQDVNNQRLDMLLDVTSDPVVLLKRLWTGIRCNCFRMNQEAPEGRCGVCYGVGFVGGYDQFYNPRDPSGRIKVRFEPTADTVLTKQIGIQQSFVPNAWTLVYPAIHSRDVLIRFNQDGTEEYRYEVVNVTRNKMLFSLYGAQKMQVYRLDKTDIVYQFRSIRNTSNLPIKLNTTLSNLRGYGPHMHVVTVDDQITTLSQVNSTTSITFSHSHPIINGAVQNVLGHDHSILLI